MFQENPKIGRRLIVNRFGKTAAALFPAILLLAGIFAADRLGSQKAASTYPADGFQKELFSALSKEEMELLLEDANPLMLKRLKEDPEMRKQQLVSIRQLFALTNQAIKDGLADDENMAKALDIIDATVWARAYDQEINKGKSQMPPFGLITEERVKAFYGEDGNATPEQKEHTGQFDKFLQVQLAFARKNNALLEDIELSAEDRAQFKQEFARIKIYEAEAKAKAKTGGLPEKFVKKARLQSKLQLAQFLARAYSTDVLAKRTEATDDEIKRFLAEHAELNLAEKKKAEADKVLRRVKNGEDFAKLAKEFSEDPGSRDKGGLYLNVTEGTFDQDFEKAALALQPGQVSPVVETPLGYHIVKLVRKESRKDASGQAKSSYDVRHIFFSTGVKDPDNPAAGELPVKEYVRRKIEEGKEKKQLEKIVADNPVSLPEDFQVRDVSDEEIRKLVESSNTNVQINGNRGNYNK
jgi:parvulin-like peptidyl-prolyl isomerase